VLAAAAVLVTVVRRVRARRRGAPVIAHPVQPVLQETE